jgi:signal transduction histidine kinase
MRPRLRLKTKLVLAISGMVVALVAALSFIYVSQMVRQSVHEVHDDAQFTARQVYHLSRKALETDLSNTPLDPSDEAAVRRAISDILQTDPGLTGLLESVIGYKVNIYDVTIADGTGHALMHSDTSMLGRSLPERPSFSAIHDGGLRQQFKVVFGAPQIYEVRLPLERNGRPFGSVRVGLSTTLLRSTLRPQVTNALVFAAMAIFISLLLAAGLSNLALRPLEAISRRLDRMVGAPEAGERPAGDEYGVVSTKIERLDRQMQDVKEVFSALKENLDQIMANLEDGVMLFTRDARAVLVSASVETFVGKPRGEMLGRNVEEIFDPMTALGATVLDAFRLRQPLSQSEVSENARRTQVSVDFIEEDGESIGALITMRDAESVRRIEDEIELSRRLAAIGRLTSGVAHEVKNPINAIVVHLELLRQKMEQADPTTKRHMEVIGSEIQRLDRVVQTLVDFTRPVELRLADMDLRRLLEDVVMLAAPEASQHGVTVEPMLPPEPLPVKADADLMKQAVLNVVINGIQAMPGGGRLTVAAARVDGEAEVSIADQGGGITPEIRDKIFNLYFTTKKSGSGIGLPMTYRVLQLHNGSVDFDSIAGQGTTFRLRLPLSEAAPRTASREMAAQS